MGERLRDRRRKREREGEEEEEKGTERKTGVEVALTKINVLRR